MENENEIMILIKVKEERRGERVGNLKLQKCHYSPYTLTLPFKLEHGDQITITCEKWSCRRSCLVLLLECLLADGKSQHEEW